MISKPKILKALAVLGVVSCIVLLFLICDYVLYPKFARPTTTDFNQGHNGLWLGSKWYMGKVSDEDFTAIAKLLNSEQIAFAYFHCKDIGKDGRQRIPSMLGAKQLVEKLHKLCPKTKIIVWMGAVNAAFGGDVDLSKKSIRSNMAEDVAELVTAAKFDGLQWDFEPIMDGDLNFLDLLKKTRAKLPSHSLLGTAVPPYWSESYIGKVALNCDQIAVMAYDTAVWLPRAYAILMSSLVDKFESAITRSGAACKLIIGVPTYEDVSLGHHAPAECLPIALIGVKNALANSKNNAVFEGIAPYAEYTTDLSEWQIYERYWLESEK